MTGRQESRGSARSRVIKTRVTLSQLSRMSDGVVGNIDEDEFTFI